MSYAALKWFHSLCPSNGANPLDSSICHNLLEAARRKSLPTLLRVLLISSLVLLLILRICELLVSTR